MRKFISLFLVFSLLVLSGNLMAKEKRGAILIVQKKDGKEKRGEILNLQWDQVDLLAREIRIENTKSGSNRTVDINSLLFEEFVKLKNEKRKKPVYLRQSQDRKALQEIADFLRRSV